MIERIDPLGRRTNFDHAANGVDLLAVRQTKGTANDVVAGYANYTPGHQPQTTYAYTGDGHLSSVTGPVSGATTSCTYDGSGRPGFWLLCDCLERHFDDAWPRLTTLR